jgi:hypothetical protein
MSNVLKKFGAGAAALAAPFVVLTASPRALAEDCKQAPPPPSSRASYVTDLSKPFLIADASSVVAQASPADCSPPPRTAVDVIYDKELRIQDTLRRSAGKFGDPSSEPGG